MFNLHTLLGAVALIGSAYGGLIPRQATVTQVWRSTGSIEGIGVRSNGMILASSLSNADIYQVDPTAKTGTKLLTLPGGVTAAAGMVEVEPDVWYVVAGKYSGGRNTAGSWGIIKIDMNAATPAATVVKIIPESKLMNGLSKWTNTSVLIGDAQAGSVYRMDVTTGAYSAVVTADPAMTPGTGIPFGIDGVRYNNGSVYFTNISKSTLSKFTLDASGKAGAVQQVYSGTPGDDMCFDTAGNAYVATNTQNSVIRVDSAGKITKVATVSGSTITMFGRTDTTKNTLYVGGGSGVSSFPVTM